MAKRSLLPDAVEHYVSEVITRQTPLLRRLRTETDVLPRGRMQIGPDQGQFMGLLTKLIGARLCIASVMPSSQISFEQRRSF